MNREVDISESWEDIDETELEKRLKEEKTKREQDMSSATENQNGLLTNGDDGSFRPRILQRPKAQQQNQIKILKRPESSSGSSSNQKNNSKTQIKTLEQREKEYAEARLRILGSTETTATVDQKLSPTSSVNNLQTFSQQQQQKVPDNIIRLPKGPDIAGGFNIRR